ncbi:P-loop containing nucleoside triphosphate hydrolase protein [Scleroderma citrinum]
MSAHSSAFSTPTTLTDMDSSDGIGLSDPITSQHRRALLDLVNRLRNTGIQRDIDLPMIAVIGNQSAGKSSLIESISGITLPRSSGTCTRCPTECKLTRSDTPWSCVVKLHFHTDIRGEAIPPRIESFGDAMSDKSEVEERIRRAQRAILNPSTNPDIFLGGATVQDDGTSFSRNYISLEISGRELEDLSFVDLPGLIASVGQHGKVDDIELVRKLVVSYIERESCVILLTVACETDFENQGAHHLAKQYDPEGQRTVGVLTKPDRIPRGEEESWIQLIRNEREPLANNWYCVKQPSSHDLSLGITWADARRQEEEWFTTNQPWRNLDSYHKSLLRTSKLVERLSNILAELIAKRLPEIQEELYKVLQQTEKELAELPQPPSSNPLGDVLRVLDEFKKELSQRVEGTPDADGLLQTIRPHNAKFRREIYATAPYFVPWKKSEAARHGTPDATFLYNEEEDKDDQDEDEGIYIDEVMDRAQISRTRELPDHYPFVVQKMYIAEFVKKWQQPTVDLFDAVYAILKKDVERMVNSHFAQMGRGGAKQSVMMIMYDHLEAAANRSKEKIDWLLKVEQSPATLNTLYYLDYKNKFLAHYKACRHNDKLPSEMWLPSQKDANDAIFALSRLGIHVQRNDLSKLLPSDPMEAALGIMASVRGYFQVVYKRFVDEVPMAIDYEAIRGLERNLEQALRDGLQLTGPDAHDRCALMLQESPAIAAKRTEITRRLERLQAAKLDILQLSI